MITKRIIPCLDVRDGRVVKGVNFEGIRDVSSPVELARYYSSAGADELVFYDITASFEGRKLFTDVLTETARQVFIPLTVGGGINTVADFERVLGCGADKVSVNSGAIRNPSLIGEAARLYGDQCVVLSADVRRVSGEFHVFAKGGREDTGMEAIEWIRRCVGNGAGEVVVNSIDTDGVKGGFDLEMLDAVCRAVSVPVIASGGAGCAEDFIRLFRALFFLALGCFAVSLVMFIVSQQKFVDLAKQLYPEKRGSVYDMRFAKKWYESCDEAERLLIGQASKAAYSASQTACLAMWLLLVLSHLFFQTGLIPVAAVSVIWLVTTVTYFVKSIQLSAHKAR